MEKLTIIKVGGKIVETPASLNALLDDFATVEGKKILVHGGGRSATAIATRLGIESKMVDGRRITDAETLEVVTMVYGGLVNKGIVVGLQKRDMNALGLTGADLCVIQSDKRPVQTIDYGFVGDVKKVDADKLALLLDQDIVPVLAPLSFSKEHGLLNTNADTIASETAKALSAKFDTTLVYCFEKKGVLYNPDDDDSVIEEITPEIYEKYTRSLMPPPGTEPVTDSDGQTESLPSTDLPPGQPVFGEDFRIYDGLGVQLLYVGIDPAHTDEITELQTILSRAVEPLDSAETAPSLYMTVGDTTYAVTRGAVFDQSRKETYALANGDWERFRELVETIVGAFPDGAMTLPVVLEKSSDVP